MTSSLYTLLIPISMFGIDLYLLIGIKEDKRPRMVLAGLLIFMPLGVFLSSLIRTGGWAFTLLPFVVTGLVLGLVVLYIEFRKGGYQEYTKLFKRRFH